MSTQSIALLAFSAILVIGAIAALGGLLAFWNLVALIDFRRRGYRVRRLPPREFIRWTPGPKPYLYEERCGGGAVRGLPFTRVVIRDGYPALCTVHFPGERSWDAEVPEWARGRRSQILERVVELLGPSSRIEEGPP